MTLVVFRYLDSWICTNKSVQIDKGENKFKEKINVQGSSLFHQRRKERIEQEVGKGRQVVVAQSIMCEVPVGTERTCF